MTELNKFQLFIESLINKYKVVYSTTNKYYFQGDSSITQSSLKKLDIDYKVIIEKLNQLDFNFKENRIFLEKCIEEIIPSNLIHDNYKNLDFYDNLNLVVITTEKYYGEIDILEIKSPLFHDEYSLEFNPSYIKKLELIYDFFNDDSPLILDNKNKEEVDAKKEALEEKINLLSEKNKLDPEELKVKGILAFCFFLNNRILQFLESQIKGKLSLSINTNPVETENDVSFQNEASKQYSLHFNLQKQQIAFLFRLLHSQEYITSPKKNIGEQETDIKKFLENSSIYYRNNNKGFSRAQGLPNTFSKAANFKENGNIIDKEIKFLENLEEDIIKRIENLKKLRGF